jgi:hypothetical protein
MYSILILKMLFLNFRDDYPDMQLQFIAGSGVSDGGLSLKNNDNVKDSV